MAHRPGSDPHRHGRRAYLPRHPKPGSVRMPSPMTTLDPAPEVVFADPWRLLATEAGRYARGLSSTVQMYEGQRLDRARTTYLGIPDDVDTCVKSFAFSAGVSE
jgi:hypothetical protein